MLLMSFDFEKINSLSKNGLLSPIYMNFFTCNVIKGSNVVCRQWLDWFLALFFTNLPLLFEEH